MLEKAEQYEEAFRRITRLDESGDNAEAIRLAKETALQAEERNDSAFALFFAAEALCLDGNLAGAEPLLSKAASSLAEIAFVQNNYAILLSLRGKVTSSIEVLDAVLGHDPKNLPALAQKAICLAKLGKEAEAIRCFDDILAIDPRNTHALTNKGVALSRLGQENEGLIFLEKALAINPQDPHTISERRILLEEMELRRTPLGPLILWFRKRLLPWLRRNMHRYR